MIRAVEDWLAEQPVGQITLVTPQPDLGPIELLSDGFKRVVDSAAADQPDIQSGLRTIASARNDGVVDPLVGVAKGSAAHGSTARCSTLRRATARPAASSVASYVASRMRRATASHAGDRTPP
jgi:hypothetical protein